MGRRAAWRALTAAVFVDCLFGSGLTRELVGELERLLRALAAAHDSAHRHRPAERSDSSDSGELLNADLPRYDLTIALGAWKFAHWPDAGHGDDGRTAAGRYRCCAGCRARRGSLRAPARSTRRRRDAHKYSRGLLGRGRGRDAGRCGARLRSGAMHAGAGYVKLFAEDEASRRAAWAGGRARPPVRSGARRADLAQLLVGPGLGRGDGRARAARLGQCWRCDLPTVLDADALVLLAPAMLERRSAPLVADAACRRA